MFHDRALERYRSGLHEIETMRRFSRAKNHFAGIKLFFNGITREQLDVMRAHAGKKRMSCNLFPNVFVLGEIVGLTCSFHTCTITESRPARSAPVG